jgi:hypothetical protein
MSLSAPRQSRVKLLKHGNEIGKVKLSLCLTDYALRHEGVWGCGCIDSHFLDLVTS